VSDVDGQLVFKASLPPTGGVNTTTADRETKKQTFQAIEASWPWSPYFFTPDSLPPVGGNGIGGQSIFTASWW